MWNCNDPQFVLDMFLDLSKTLLDIVHCTAVLHMFRQLLFWAGKQSNHQIFDPLLATQETMTDFHGAQWYILLIGWVQRVYQVMPAIFDACQKTSLGS